MSFIAHISSWFTRGEFETSSGDFLCTLDNRLQTTQVRMIDPEFSKWTMHLSAVSPSGLMAFYDPFGKVHKALVVYNADYTERWLYEMVNTDGITEEVISATWTQDERLAVLTKAGQRTTLVYLDKDGVLLSAHILDDAENPYTVFSPSTPTNNDIYYIDRHTEGSDSVHRLWRINAAGKVTHAVERAIPADVLYPSRSDVLVSVSDGIIGVHIDRPDDLDFVTLDESLNTLSTFGLPYTEGFGTTFFHSHDRSFCLRQIDSMDVPGRGELVVRFNEAGEFSGAYFQSTGGYSLFTLPTASGDYVLRYTEVASQKDDDLLIPVFDRLTGADGVPTAPWTSADSRVVTDGSTAPFIAASLPPSFTAHPGFVLSYDPVTWYSGFTANSFILDLADMPTYVEEEPAPDPGDGDGNPGGGDGDPANTFVGTIPILHRLFSVATAPYVLQEHIGKVAVYDAMGAGGSKVLNTALTATVGTWGWNDFTTYNPNSPNPGPNGVPLPIVKYPAKPDIEDLVGAGGTMSVTTRTALGPSGNVAGWTFSPGLTVKLAGAAKAYLNPDPWPSQNPGIFVKMEIRKAGGVADTYILFHPLSAYDSNPVEYNNDVYIDTSLVIDPREIDAPRYLQNTIGEGDEITFTFLGNDAEGSAISSPNVTLYLWSLVFKEESGPTGP